MSGICRSIEEYHFQDHAGIPQDFIPYKTPEEYWAYWSLQYLLQPYCLAPGKTYADLLELVRNKNYFYCSFTNVDHQFQLAGFGQETTVLYAGGIYGLAVLCALP